MLGIDFLVPGDGGLWQRGIEQAICLRRLATE